MDRSNRCNIQDILDIRFDIDWQDMNLSKQTVFPVVKNTKGSRSRLKSTTVRRGRPIPNTPYTLRATKKVIYGY